MGHLISGRRCPPLDRLEALLCPGEYARHHLPDSDWRHPAAKRRGGRFGGRFRRIGQPDGFRAARRGDIPFPRDYMVRGDVHVDVDAASSTRADDVGGQWAFRVGAILEAGAEVGAGSAWSTCATGNSRPAGCASGSCSCAVRASGTANATGIAVGATGSSAAWAGSAVARRGEVLRADFPSSCGRGGTGRRTSLRGWR